MSSDPSDWQCVGGRSPTRAEPDGVLATGEPLVPP
jgi:hypothetical protein